MRKILGAIFGSQKNSETIVSGAVSGIDKIFFTKEEKAEANKAVADWYLKYLAATQPQNLARRLIAMIVVLLWAALVVLGVASYKLDESLSKFVFDTLEQLVNEPFMIIMGFYFLAHVVRTYNEGGK